METLPQLCTELIAQHLGKLCKDPREAAWNGASLSLVGGLGPLLYPNDSNTGFVTCEMSRIVYEFADPGSLKARGDALNKNATDRSIWTSSLKNLQDPTVATNTTIGKKLDQLKSECKERKIKCTGTKSVLIQRIVEDDLEKKDTFEACLKESPLSSRKCQVRPCARRWIQKALKDPEAQLNVTAVKDTYKLTDKDLEPLLFEYRDNPYGRGRPPMRLFDVVDVVKAYNQKKTLGQKEDAEYWSYIDPDRYRQIREQAILQAKKEAEQRIKEEQKEKERKIRELQAEKERKIREEQAEKERKIREEQQEARRTLLAQSLNEVGCELRSDSTLCSKYINHGLGDIKDVVKVMREMKFYFDETRYQEEFSNIHAQNRSYNNRYDHYDRYDRYDRFDDYDDDDNYYEDKSERTKDNSETAKSNALVKWINGDKNHRVGHPSLAHEILSSLRDRVFRFTVDMIVKKVDAKINAEMMPFCYPTSPAREKNVSTLLSWTYVTNVVDDEIIEAHYSVICEPLRKIIHEYKEFILGLKNEGNQDIFLQIARTCTNAMSKVVIININNPSTIVSEKIKEKIREMITKEEGDFRQSLEKREKYELEKILRRQNKKNHQTLIEEQQDKTLVCDRCLETGKPATRLFTKQGLEAHQNAVHK